MKSFAASEMKRAFDAAFAAPEPPPRDPPERFLALTAGTTAYAVRIRDVSALTRARRIARLPGARAELLGLAGHRGALVPVLDLAVLLGHGSSAAPRWLILCGTDEPIALAASEVGGQIEAARADVMPVRDGRAQRHVDAVLGGTPSRAILDVASILRTITEREP